MLLELQNSIPSDYYQDDVDQDYRCLCNLFFDCAEALTSFTFENVYWILKSTCVGNVFEDHLSLFFTKVLPIRV